MKTPATPRLAANERETKQFRFVKCSFYCRSVKKIQIKSDKRKTERDTHRLRDKDRRK